jgi:4-hydroxybenzoate polyprenyltransferase
MRQLVRIYLNKYIHLALCTTLIIFFTFKSVGATTSWIFAVWAGVATLFLYNYHHVSAIKVESVPIFIRNHTGLSLLSGVLLISGILIAGMEPQGIMALLSAFLLSFFYFIPVTVHKITLRSYYILKPLTIGLVFGLITAFIPYLKSGYSWHESLFLTAGRCAFIIALSLLFDIGDIEKDAVSQTKTFVQRVGIRKTKIAASLLLSAAGIIEGYGAWIFLTDFHCFMALLITYILSWVLIIYAEPQSAAWYYLLLVDGMIGLPWVLSFL